MCQLGLFIEQGEYKNGSQFREMRPLQTQYAE